MDLRVRTFGFFGRATAGLTWKLDQLLLDHVAVEAGVKNFNDVRMPAFRKYIDLREETVEAFSLVHLALGPEYFDGNLLSRGLVDRQLHSK